MLKNELFMSYQRFKKGAFCYPDHFFESLITHKRFIFEHNYVLYGKRQKSCTLIVILGHIIVSGVSDL